MTSRIAVVDLGTNSTRLLVADVEGSEVEEVLRESTVTSLGRGVEVSGHLSSEGIEAVSEAVARYRAAWEELGAGRSAAIATSAVRDATNGDAFVAEMRERFALQARVLTGEEEAATVFRGATSGRADSDEPTLVVDIGGGSTELVMGAGGEIALATSLQAGVLRHSERFLREDPPSPEELEALADDIRALIAGVLEDSPALEPGRAIAVAGTPAALAAIELGTDDRATVHGHVLTLDAVQASLSRLAALPLAERQQVVGLRADRAPFIVAGTVILAQVMRAFGITEVEVSERDALHGVALEMAAP